MCKGTNSRKAIYLSEERICMNFDFPPRQATTWTSLTVEHARREYGHPTACVSISVLTMLAARRQSIARRANNAATWRTKMNINGYWLYCPSERTAASSFFLTLPNLVKVKSSINIVVLDLLLFLALWNDSMFCLKPIAKKLWFLAPHYFRGHFKEIGVAALLLIALPRHMEKFRKYRPTDSDSLCQSIFHIHSPDGRTVELIPLCEILCQPCTDQLVLHRPTIDLL